jgi:hypothetical protein
VSTPVSKSFADDLAITEISVFIGAQVESTDETI